MPLAIEDYALVGDCFSGALVGRDGSIDWLCLPRFDSPSVFSALLGSEENGRWLLAPTSTDASSERRYDGAGFTLVTHWTTPTGEVEVIDCMPVGDHRAEFVRRVRGLTGSVELHQELRLRFDYGATVPWMSQNREADPPELVAVAGPNAVIVRGPALTGSDRRHSGVFTVAAGETVDISLVWYPSHREPPPAVDVDAQLERTRDWWREWLGHYRNPVESRFEPIVQRSLLVLRALTHEHTGGITAAATTSLPEQFGGPRNWDYRFVWLRDASLTIDVLTRHGFEDEVERWRQWLLRAVAGDPADVQIMYGLGGERYLPERELPHLPGYQGARPVRVGNAASEQFQADVIGEVLLALDSARQAGTEESEVSWGLQRALLAHLEKVWDRPDEGIWEIRGTPREFTHSRAMCWAAFDRGVRAVERYGLKGPAQRWRELRDRIRAEIDARHVDPSDGAFVQYAGASHVDAALLQLPQIGFCEPDDPRMLATVARIERELLHDGLVHRYVTETGVDGLPPGENPFLACSFWLAEQYARSGRRDDAERMLDRLVALANDVGMLSEEYAPAERRQAGNTPQALSHLALVRAVNALADGVTR
ncbi:glycoside hydrolase family 15 protein [Gryllotalpicola ginsengisoli]|uniref:glycoside hydrolase family 15 protein n=1 Tax=Gryllotalpicola ginsengisoli TaxID=444608 RepID=UPI0003B6FF71|nr:glycoside hydrolase family 15 protein [Gryllotalpicola ginsengisoli]